MRACAENLSALYGQVRHAAQTLHAQATEIHELTQRLESLTKDPRLYAGTRAKVEARAGPGKDDANR